MITIEEIFFLDFYMISYKKCNLNILTLIDLKLISNK